MTVTPLGGAFNRVPAGEMLGKLDSILAVLKEDLATDLREEMREAREKDGPPAPPEVEVNVAAPNVTVAAPNVTVTPTVLSPDVTVDLSSLNERLGRIESILLQICQVMSKSVTKTVVRDNNSLIISITEKRT